MQQHQGAYRRLALREADPVGDAGKHRRDVVRHVVRPDEHRLHEKVRERILRRDVVAGIAHQREQGIDPAPRAEFVHAPGAHADTTVVDRQPPPDARQEPRQGQHERQQRTAVFGDPAAEASTARTRFGHASAGVRIFHRRTFAGTGCHFERASPSLRDSGRAGQATMVGWRRGCLRGNPGIICRASRCVCLGQPAGCAASTRQSPARLRRRSLDDSGIGRQPYRSGPARRGRDALPPAAAAHADDGGTGAAAAADAVDSPGAAGHRGTPAIPPRPRTPARAPRVRASRWSGSSMR